MARKSCKNCKYRTTKALQPPPNPGEDRIDGLYCIRFKHWLQEDTMQISIGFQGGLCDFKPKVKKPENVTPLGE